MIRGAAAERIFRLDSSHLESSSSDSLYVEDDLYIFSGKIPLSADIRGGPAAVGSTGLRGQAGPAQVLQLAYLAEMQDAAALDCVGVVYGG